MSFGIKQYLFTIILFLLTSIVNAEKGNEKQKAAFFIQPELLIGKALPSNSNFPKTELERILSISFGKFVQDTSRSWSVFYNYPSFGVSVTYSHFGENDVFGNAYSIIPYIAISTSKKQTGNLYFKIGLCFSKLHRLKSGYLLFRLFVSANEG